MGKNTKWLKLFLAWELIKEGIGSAKIRKIYDELKSLDQVDSEGIVKSGSSEIPQDFKQKLQKLKTKIIIQDESGFPERLKDLINDPECKMQNPPVILFGIGDLNLLNYKKIVTIVGTRKMTCYGERIIEELFSRAGDEVVYLSGLAYGVDSKVHKVALDNGIKTIAIVAGGIDQGYPKRNYWLYKRICSEGLVISEFPPGRAAIKGMYPMRNRLMAAMGDSVVVIESDKNGGSLITADYGLKYGKPVYAAPGSILSHGSTGTNQLLTQRSVSVLVQSVVVELLGDSSPLISQRTIPPWLDMVLKEYGDHDGMSCEAIYNHCVTQADCAMTISHVKRVLNQLTLDGVLLQKNGKYMRV